MAAGKLDLSVVDTAVARTLRTKFKMGLFENPNPAAPANETKSLIHTKEAVDLARKLDAESIVLLENRDAVLPLKREANVALIGPFADVMNVSRVFFHQVPFVFFLQFHLSRFSQRCP